MKGRGFLKQREGSAIVGALVIAIITGTIVAGVFSSATTEMKMSRRYLEGQHAITMAEAGLEEGVRALKSGNWTGWTAYGSYGKFLELDGSTDGVYAGMGRTGKIKIYVHANLSDPSVAAEASISSVATGDTITRQIRVDMSTGSLFDNGVVSRVSTIFKGGNVLVDSYDSRLGSYTLSSLVNRFANGTVATLAVLNDAIDIGNGNVRGYIATGGGLPDIGSNGTIHDYAGGPYSSKYKDWSRVTTDFYADLPTIEYPDTTSYTNLGTINSSTTIGGAGTQGFIVDAIDLTGGGTLQINGDVKLVVKGDVKIAGTGMIAIDGSGSMEMYADGSVTITGNGMANNSGIAEKALIYGMHTVDGEKEIKLGGNASLYAAVYAPTYNFDVVGGGSDGKVFGAVVGYTVTLNGGVNFHYDEALSEMNGGDNFTIDSWRELRDAGERLPFDTPSDLSSHF